MRTSTLLSSLLLTLTSVAASPDSSNTCPFERAIFVRSFVDEPQLERRQNNGCGANLISCSFLARPGAGSACCASNAICTLDNAGNVACCPAGAFCTGTLTSVPATPPITTSTTTGTGIVITTPTIGGPLPTYTPGQYINNAFFPFPVLWLAGAQFPDANQCAAAYQTCDAYYNSCTSQLQTGGPQTAPGYGVTVSAPGGGFTVGGGGGVQGPIEVASATSICQSLRNIGCPGQGATCGGTAPTGTPTQTGFVIVTPSSWGEKGKNMKGGSAAALVAIVAWFVMAW